MKMELRRRSLDKIFKRRDRIDMPEFQLISSICAQDYDMMWITVMRKTSLRNGN